MNDLIKLHFIETLDNNVLAIKPLFIKKEAILMIGYYSEKPFPILPDKLEAYKGKLINEGIKESSSIIFVGYRERDYINSALKQSNSQFDEDDVSFAVYESPEEIIKLMNGEENVVLFRNPILDKPVTYLNCSTRINNILKAEGVHLVSDLVKYTAVELLKTPIGGKSLRSIQDALALHGLSLSMSGV